MEKVTKSVVPPLPYEARYVYEPCEAGCGMMVAFFSKTLMGSREPTLGFWERPYLSGEPQQWWQILHSSWRCQVRRKAYLKEVLEDWPPPRHRLWVDRDEHDEVVVSDVIEDSVPSVPPPPADPPTPPGR